MRMTSNNTRLWFCPGQKYSCMDCQGVLTPLDKQKVGNFKVVQNQGLESIKLRRKKNKTEQNRVLLSLITHKRMLHCHSICRYT